MLVSQRVSQCDAIFDAMIAPNQPDQFEGFKPWVGSPLASQHKEKKTQTVLIGQMKVDPVGMWVKADFIPLTFRIHHPKAKHSKPQLETGHGPWLSG